MNERATTWWGRNWKWFVPAGCLTALLLMATFVGLVVYGVAGMMKSSDAYREALLRAKRSPAVVQDLGEPIQEGFMASGNINISGPSGHADLAIPISGPKGKGTIYLVAEKSAGEWTFSKLVVELEPEKRSIDLLEQAPAPSVPALK